MPLQDQLMAQKILTDQLGIEPPSGSKGADSRKVLKSMQSSFKGAAKALNPNDEEDQMVFKKISDLSMSSSNAYKTFDNNPSIR